MRSEEDGAGSRDCCGGWRCEDGSRPVRVVDARDLISHVDGSGRGGGTGSIAMREAQRRQAEAEAAAEAAGRGGGGDSGGWRCEDGSRPVRVVDARDLISHVDGSGRGRGTGSIAMREVQRRYAEAEAAGRGGASGSSDSASGSSDSAGAATGTGGGSGQQGHPPCPDALAPSGRLGSQDGGLDKAAATTTTTTTTTTAAAPAAAGSGAGAGEGQAAGRSVGEDEIRRVASLMRIDIGEEGGDEARSHIDKVRTMIGYFDILDAAGAGDGDGDGDMAAAAGPRCVQIGDLRDDEPEEGAAERPPADRYARVQQEGGTYVRAPAMSP